MAWALYGGGHEGAPNRAVRLHLNFNVLEDQPALADVTIGRICERKSWEEQWELEARKDTPVNRFKVQDKFLGMYLFEEDPEEEDDQESDEISEVTQDSKEEGKKSDEKPPPIGECKIVGIYWQKEARGSHKVWRGVVRKVVQDQEPASGLKL